VITPDGTVVPEFSIVVKQIADKPQLVQRKHFKQGEFTVDHLNPSKYVLQISAPTFIDARIIFDFTNRPRDTDYSIVILHQFRNEARLLPEQGYSISLKRLQQRVPEAAREAYSRGIELHREGKLDEALIEYGTAVRNYPRYIDALSDIGTILLLFNRPEAALMFLRRAQDVDAGNPDVNLNIAVALTEQGDYGGALKLLKDIQQTEPRMAHVQYFIGKIYYLQKKYDQAERYIQEAINNDPHLLEALLLMINISIDQKKYDQAREGLERMRAAMNNQMVTKFIDEQLSTLGS